MESPSLMPSDSIKLEPDSELVQMDCVQNSAEEALTEVQTCDNMESQIPAVVKTEQPEVCLDNPEMPLTSEINSSVSTNKNAQNGMHDTINMELVKQEPPDTLSEDTSHGFHSVVDMATGSFQENTECRHAEATVTENGCKMSLNHENVHQISENKSSVIKISNSLFFNRKNQHLQKSGKELNHSNMWRKSLDLSVGFAGCFPHGQQTGDMPAVSVDTHLNRYKGTIAEEKSITCDICGASFAQTSNLNRHKKIHTGEKPYKCVICGSSFVQPGNLRIHERIHTGEKHYICDICGASFGKSGHLKCHKRKHTGEKPYKCDVCDASFAQTSNLSRHKLTHTGERPYKCSICVASFAQPGNLKIHEKMHRGEKLHTCDVCGASFAKSGHLKCHKRKHTGEKPYKCDVCDASFAQTSHLDRHKKIHTGEKPHKCDICGGAFAQPGNLKIHERVHIGNRRFKCDGCGASFMKSRTLWNHKKTQCCRESLQV